MKIKAVTFDAGGTLLQPWPSVGHVYAEVAGWHGHPAISADAINHQFFAAWKCRGNFDYSRIAWAGIVDASFAGLIPVKPSGTFFNVLYDHFSSPAAWRIYDDVLPTLDALEKRGVRLAVISNWDERLEPLLEEMGLAERFEVITVSHFAGCCKPDPRIFETTLQRLRVSADSALHIGDSESDDVVGAQGAGMQAALIDRSRTTLLDLALAF